MNQKRACVFGAGGFIGSHLVKRLKLQGYWVRGVDLKFPEFSETAADDFVKCDLRVYENVKSCLSLSDGASFDVLYQLAADMGGAGYIFTGENDANVMHSSALINLNTVGVLMDLSQKPKIFYSSSACIYPEYNQKDEKNPICSEESAYPAAPDSEYGWEKIFSERLYLSFHRNYEFDVRVARFHNIFGPECSWDNGKEKSPAAICRKVSSASDGGEIEIWSDGEQTRSYLYIDECLEAVDRFMDSDFTGPINIGSEEMVSINFLANTVSKIAGKNLALKHVTGPVGVRGRKSDNDLYEKIVGWRVSQPLIVGLEKTYAWIDLQNKSHRKKVSS